VPGAPTTTARLVIAVLVPNPRTLEAGAGIVTLFLSVHNPEAADVHPKYAYKRLALGCPKITVPPLIATEEPEIASFTLLATEHVVDEAEEQS